ncbi:MAG: hypothetical protein EOM20_15045 [Spartobacteria bacterium]|nr:hypothetical protein [Spartobacteria bacterium]
MNYQKMLQVACLGLLLPAMCRGVSSMDVPASQGAAVTIYDTGFALVRERRQVSVMAGENTLYFRDMPVRLKPLTVSFSPPAQVTGIVPVDEQFVYDLATPETFVRSRIGRPVELQTSASLITGTLLAGPGTIGEDGPDTPFVVEQADGKLVFVKQGDIQSAVFPGVEDAYIRPTFIWRVDAREETMQNMRMNYSVDGMRWEAAYEVVLSDDQTAARLSCRFMLSNQSGCDFHDVQLRLVATEKGVADQAHWKEMDVMADARKTTAGLRYVYGNENLTFAEWIGNLAPLFTHPLPTSMTLADGAAKYVEFLTVDHVKVARFFVYDGVKFDRFQRNRRNDWNYGTETHHVVESYLDFLNSADNGLGMDLPPGVFRLYQQEVDGTIDLVGEDTIGVTLSGEAGDVRLGPARGLRGERERTGYAEIIPLHEYEESFEIRLENDSSRDVEIRVVEHLYRWHDFEIVRADTQYTQTGPQTIEFRPRLKAGGKRSVHYTVRYRW